MLKAAIDYLPTKKFDKSLVQAAYVLDTGTIYKDGYERLAYHINKIDDYGNTLLGISCQNGNLQTCKYLVAKGANPNHQNVAGQTPAHFAIAFKSYNLSQWLFENGANDLIENKFGLTPYDGLTPEAYQGQGDDIAIEG
jgi:ankyrin repeat protein